MNISLFLAIEQPDEYTCVLVLCVGTIAFVLWLLSKSGRPDEKTPKDLLYDRVVSKLARASEEVDNLNFEAREDKYQALIELCRYLREVASGVVSAIDKFDSTIGGEDQESEKWMSSVRSFLLKFLEAGVSYYLVSIPNENFEIKNEEAGERLSAIIQTLEQLVDSNDDTAKYFSEETYPTM